jgi:hypothetical protein
MIQCLLRDVVVVKIYIPMQCGFEILGGGKVMGLQYLGNAAIEAFDHAIGLRVAGWYQAMLDALFGTGPIEDVLSGGPMFPTQTPIREFRAVVGQALLNTEGCGLNQGFQEGFG